MKSIQKGFTLIELMIVVAIIGILAAIAIPAYQDYTVRAQVTEGMNLASAVKAGVAEYYAQNGKWPANLSEAGGDTAKPPSGKYVSGITVDPAGGTIVVAFGNDANTNINLKTLALQPKLSKNQDVVWLCGYNTAGNTKSLSDPAGQTPSTAASKTSVTAKYLPASCRA
jgi:type IV pilus assembly protein PilA